MADSIPSLRRKNKELAERIAELEARISERVEVPVVTPVYYTKEIPVDKIVYVDNPVHLEMIASLQCKIREFMAGRHD